MINPTTLVGVDGCKNGRWVAVSQRRPSASPRVTVVGSPREILTCFPFPAVIAVDIPIGLTDRGRRAADVEARHVLKHPRASSVFPAPIRAVLDAHTREYASRLHKEVDGRGFGVQSWAILPRVRDWDVALQTNRERAREVFEVHPEVSFWALNGGESIKEGKKTERGASKRRKLVVKIFGEKAVSQLLEIGQERGAARDDVLDALVALWSAGRIARHEAKSLPHTPEFDRAKLPMAIWY